MQLIKLFDCFFKLRADIVHANRLKYERNFDPNKLKEKMNN